MNIAVELEVALRSLRHDPRVRQDAATETWIDESMAENYWTALCHQEPPPPEAAAQPQLEVNAA